MRNFEHNLLPLESTIEQALSAIDKGAVKQTLFVTDEEGKLVGTMTDGDIRRALLSGMKLDTSVKKAINEDFFYINEQTFSPEKFNECKTKKLKIVPLVNEKGQILQLLNIDHFHNFLPIQSVIMAGGKGMRLRPLTERIPKPMLEIGGKPIIEHNIDRLAKFGINQIDISLNYLGDKISNYFKDGSEKGISINYVNEDKPLGTIGALNLIKNFEKDCILIMNSDLLTNIDFAEMYDQFLKDDADMIIATTSYKVKVPYAVLETKGNKVKSFVEKPTLNYPTNAGIYMIRKSCIDHIPNEEEFNATDLIETLIDQNKKVTHFPILSYWLDIGKPLDFEKAQEDIKHLKL